MGGGGGGGAGGFGDRVEQYFTAKLLTEEALTKVSESGHVHMIPILLCSTVCVHVIIGGVAQSVERENVFQSRTANPRKKPPPPLPPAKYYDIFTVL